MPHAPRIPLDFPLRGDRVLLRPFEQDDAVAAHRIYGDPEVMRYVGAGGAVSPGTTAQMIDGYRRHQREHGFAFWAVIERSTGELIGDAGLELTRFGIELGYTLARSAWGQGLATEAAQLCVDAAFGPLGVSRLVALVDVENPASSRVLDKLGFGPGAVRSLGAGSATGAVPSLGTAPATGEAPSLGVGSATGEAPSLGVAPATGVVIVYGRPHRRYVRDASAPAGHDHHDLAEHPPPP